MSDALHDWVVELIDAIGISGVALVMFVENIFPPIPSELVLPLAGYSVFQGDMELVPAIVAATVGSTLGAMVLYAIGAYGGMPLVLRYRRVLRLTEEQIQRAEGWFDRWGTAVVFFSRMVPLARSLVSVPAGMARMRMPLFLALTFVGSAIWNTLLISLGYGLGREWESVSDVVGVISRVVLVIVFAAVVALVVVWARRRRRASTSAAATGAGP